MKNDETSVADLRAVSIRQPTRRRDPPQPLDALPPLALPLRRGNPKSEH